MSKEKEIVISTIKDLKENVDLFYQQRMKEALQSFEQVLGKVAELVDSLFAYKESHEEFALDEGRIKEALTEAMNALEDRDMILLADIIQYDFIEHLEGLVEIME